MRQIAFDHLQVEIDSKECVIPEEIRNRMQPSLERTEQALRTFPQSQLRLTVVHHPRSHVYHAQAKLNIPGQTIKTGDQDESLETAILHCMEKVNRRAETCTAHPEREAAEPPGRAVASDAGDAGPVASETKRLDAAAREADYRAFRRVLLGHEDWLRKRIGRWIQRYPELEEQNKQSYEIADLVEEVFLLAFERYADRPLQIGIHGWLESLIDPAVKAYWYDPDDRIAVSFAETLGAVEGR